MSHHMRSRDENAMREAPPREITLFSRNEWDLLADSLALSGRELQIAERIFAECTEKEIARHCGISAHTVHTHLERLYRKLSVRSRTGVVLRICAVYLALQKQAAADDSSAAFGALR